MKKKELGLLLNIATICFCVCALVVGVYAAKTATLSISGSIGFKAHNCQVKVFGKVSGAVDSGNNAITTNTNNHTPIYCDGTNTTTGKVLKDTDTWSIGAIYFNDLNCADNEIATPIEFTFIFENLSVYYVTASIKFPSALESVVNIDGPKFTTEGYTDNSSVFLLPKSTNGTSGTEVKLSMSLTPKTDKGFSDIDLTEMKISFEKTVVENVTSTGTANTYESTLLTYTLNSKTNTVSVGAKETTISGAVKIPLAVVTEDGAAYFVESIKSNGFEGCSSLTSITIPNSVTIIETMAFEYCENLASVIFESNSKLTHIKDFAFSGCPSLTSITIPSSVTRMEQGVFRDSYILTSVTFEENSKLTHIGSNIFEDCAFSSITIPSSVTSSEGVIFRSCSINSITIPGCLTNVFENCVLGSVTVDENTKTIVSNFLGACSATSVTIPEGVTSIESKAFCCSGLESVTFEDTTSAWTLRNGSTTSNNISVSNSSQNATYLTSTYYNYTWAKNV